MKQKFLLILFAATFSLSSWAAGTVINGIHYILDSDNMTASVTYTCSSYLYTGSSNTYSGDITIPATVTLVDGLYYKYYAVTSIGGYAFAGCENVTSVTIPNSVKSIGDAAFYGCKSLTNITIPGSVTSIGKGAFGGSGLTSVTIPSSITKIEENVFNGCENLTNVSIPNSVTSIGKIAFYGDTSLTSITIPNSVTSIGESAFQGTGLKSVTIPSSVNSIGSFAFRGCTSLESISIRNKVLGGAMFRDCTNLKDVDLGTSLTSIGDAAFLDCHKLESINFPNSLMSIGCESFRFCVTLSDINFNNAPVSIGINAFSHCYGLKSITLPKSIMSIESGAFNQCSFDDVYVLHENPTEYHCNEEAFLPPRIDWSTDVNCTLHVPVRRMKAYAAIEPWSRFTKIVEEGWYDEPNVVKDLEQLSNNKAYIIHTQKEARGSLGVANGSLASTNTSAVGFKCKESGSFAIIKYEDDFYLFSIDDNKYITNTGAETIYPGKEGNHALSLYKRGDDFVIDFKATGKTLNVNTNPGLVINSYGTSNGNFDEGNLFVIEEVGDFNPNYALEMFDFVERNVKVTYVLMDDGEEVDRQVKTQLSFTECEWPNTWDLGVYDYSTNDVIGYYDCTIIVNRNVKSKVYEQEFIRQESVEPNKTYAIFNTAINGTENRYGFYYAYSSSQLACNPIKPSEFPNTDVYLWETEDAGSGLLSFKNKSTGTYINETQRVLGEKTAWEVESWVTSNAVKAPVNSLNENEKVVSNTDISASDKVFTVTNPSASGKSLYWNGNDISGGNAMMPALWDKAHPYAFYTIEQVGYVFNTYILKESDGTVVEKSVVKQKENAAATIPESWTVNTDYSYEYSGTTGSDNATIIVTRKNVTSLHDVFKQGTSAMFYDLHGHRVIEPKSGQIVVVVYSDGTSRKMLVK